MNYSIRVEAYIADASDEDGIELHGETVTVEARNSIEACDKAGTLVLANIKEDTGLDMTSWSCTSVHPLVALVEQQMPGYDDDELLTGEVEYQHAYDTGADISDGLTDDEK